MARRQKKTAKTTGATCLLGGLFGILTGGGAQGGMLGCKVAAGVMAVTTIVDELGAHWSEQMRRGLKAWRLYKWSFDSLQCDPWESPEKKYRQCALKNHPDKLPQDADEKRREFAAQKFANCRFAVHYIRVFRKKYGVLDVSEVSARTGFLKAFAGVWATTFSEEDRMQDSEIDELAAMTSKRNLEL
jgi:hypothetical protein